MNCLNSEQWGSKKNVHCKNEFALVLLVFVLVVLIMKDEHILIILF